MGVVLPPQLLEMKMFNHLLDLRGSFCREFILKDPSPFCVRVKQKQEKPERVLGSCFPVVSF